MKKNIIYIVICYTINNADENYHIDSAWTSCKKAEKRAKELNLYDKKEWREDYGYGLFQVEYIFISK